MRDLLYRALASPVGIVLNTDDVQGAIQRLHRARREAKDVDLDVLTIMVSRDNPTSQVWIAHQPREKVESSDGE